MIRKISTLAFAGLLIGSALAFAERPEQNRADKPEAEAVAPDAAQVAVTEEANARAIAAIPLFRTSGGARILPFVDLEGRAIPIGPALLSFQILPAPDERGNLIPILKNGPMILPFVDERGEFILIRHDRSVEK